MVLWEITLGTAYFLGLKRTYRLALRIQRRIIGSNHLKIRQVVQRRTRTIFDVALKVHQNIQQRDLEVGRNFGNWILRWLDQMKPSAQIRPSSPVKPPKMSKQTTTSSHPKTTMHVETSKNMESDRHLFTARMNKWVKPLPTIAMMMRQAKPAGNITQFRQFSTWGSETLMLSPRTAVSSRSGGFIRKDIMQYLLHN